MTLQTDITTRKVWICNKTDTNTWHYAIWARSASISYLQIQAVVRDGHAAFTTLDIKFNLIF